eukprot:CAMPEP_0119480188 /NCGR_PEP_ID=MMETSP1344-20130328/9107_1 /TAXON_ID=236787 /ORGANISM="Florenciella parvula, Strain CCMP2471" /LENGTH=194 /DNA_ID=CAMNT_0007514477 /DNA_START=292 /DNA_END=878 /DNA_ORIENTATION=-
MKPDSRGSEVCTLAAGPRRCPTRGKRNRRSRRKAGVHSWKSPLTNPAADVIRRKIRDLAVAPSVEEAARRVVGPRADAVPSGKKATELISDEWYLSNVCVLFPVLKSHTFALASTDPDANMFGSVGQMATLMQSQACSEKNSVGVAVSMSQWMHLASPEAVSIWLLPIKRQQDKYPSCCESSLLARSTDCWLIL